MTPWRKPDIDRPRRRGFVGRTVRKILIVGAATGLLHQVAHRHYPKQTESFVNLAGRLSNRITKYTGIQTGKAMRAGRRELEKESPWAKKVFRIADNASDFAKQRYGEVEEVLNYFTEEERRDFKQMKFKKLKKRVSLKAVKARLPLYRKLLKTVDRKDLPIVYRMIATDFSYFYGIDPRLSVAVMHAESKFNPMAISRADARGLMQIVPGTGNKDIEQFRLRKIVGEPKNANLYDILYNIDGGIAFLDFLRDNMKRNSKSGTDDDFLKWGVMAYNTGYSGLTSGRRGKSGRKYWNAVMTQYRKWQDVNPYSFEGKLRMNKEYSRFFGG